MRHNSSNNNGRVKTYSYCHQISILITHIVARHGVVRALCGLHLIWTRAGVVS